MDFLYFTVLMGCCFFAAVSGACQQGELAKCTGEQMPNCQTVGNIQMCISKHAADCEGEAMYQSLKATVETLLLQCSGGGGAGGGLGGCDMIVLNNCLKPLTEKLSAMPQDGSMPSQEELKGMCSVYNNFKTCMPPSCAKSPVVSGMSQQASMLDSMCTKGGCDMIGILACTQPVINLGLVNMTALDFSSKTLETSCQTFTAYKACIDSKIGDSCKSNAQFNDMTKSLELATKLIDFLCKDKYAEIMTHKECFNKPEINMLMAECNKNHSKIMMEKIMDPKDKNRPSDDKICSIINEEAMCSKKGLGAHCSEKSKNSLYDLQREGMMIMAQLGTCDDGTSGSGTIMMSVLSVLAAASLTFIF